MPKTRFLVVISSFLILSLGLIGQEDSLRLMELDKLIADKEQEIDVFRIEQEDIKLKGLNALLLASGLPTDDYVKHDGMYIGWNPVESQAAWVAHIISPDIVTGGFGRTNDFRDDPLIDGEGVEADYFLKELQADSTYIYDGFGYDRGHLAPSADFSWSRKALSESYFYSNMSPQHPDFNRESWAELEATLRGYVIRNEVPLYVVTVPIFEGENYLDRGVKKLKIPKRFAKLAWDDVNEQGVAFVMENRSTESDNADFAVSIERAEEITHFDYFQNLASSDQKGNFEIAAWYPESTRDGVEPLYAPDLPQNHINTTQAKRWMGSQKKVNVCGTVVSTRFSGSGNYWLNVDKKFPNTVFNVYIRKDDFSNFDVVNKEYLINEKVCFYGKVSSMYGLPNMNIVRQEQVSGID